MRFTKKIVASAMAVCLGAAMGVTPAFAVDLTVNDPVEYRITISAGEGEFVGLDDVLIVPAGTEINLNDYWQKQNITGLSNDNYYPKGLRYAGHDFGDEGMAQLAFRATEDAQYVVAYGLAKDQVAYTINYVDAAGNEIAPSQTYYGNVGDKPVIAFAYIDNYLPTTYNLTGTLKEDGANEFTFVYNAAPGVVYETVAVPAVPGAAAPAAAPAGAAAVADAAAAGAILGDDGTPLAAPEDIVDLDDNETPLAAGDVAENTAAASETNILPYVIGGIAAVAVVLLLVALAMRKKKPNQA